MVWAEIRLYNFYPGVNYLCILCCVNKICKSAEKKENSSKKYTAVYPYIQLLENSITWFWKPIKEILQRNLWPNVKCKLQKEINQSYSPTGLFIPTMIWEMQKWAAPFLVKVYDRWCGEVCILNPLILL